MLGGERGAPCGCHVLVGEHRQHAVADQLQHLAAGVMDGVDRGLRVVIEERDDLVRRDALADRGRTAQVGEPQHGVDALGDAARDPSAQHLLGGHSALDRVKEVAAGAKAIIAWGNCACSGCVQGANPNPTRATPINAIITDKPVVNVQGCPPIAEVMAGVLVHLLTFDRIPQLDALGRPKAFYGKRVHDTCSRRANYDAGLFVETFDDGWTTARGDC